MIFGYIDPGTGMTVGSLGAVLLTFLTGVFSVFLIFLKRLLNFFKKPGRWIAVIVIVAIGAAAGIVLFMRRGTADMDHKVIIIGFDALSPRIMEPLMADGRLKNFSRLRETGSYHHLRTTTPPESPVAWSAFASGKNPGKTGIFDFIARDPKDYHIHLSLSNTEGGVARPVVKGPRFWQYTSRKKIPTVILGCPVTFPPDRVFGKMLSGMGVPDILGTEGTFSFYTSGKDDHAETSGGKIFYVKKSPLIVTYLFGPRVARVGGNADNVRVPLKITAGGEAIGLEFQKKKMELRPGEWSPWQDVTFDLGFFRKARGIFKFYLAAVEPELKLYVSPINLDPREPFFPISHPPDYSRALVEDIGLYHTQGMPFDTWALNEKRLDEASFLDQARDVLAEREKLLNLELNRFERGVFYFYFEDVDIIQHMFWRYLDPRHPLYEPDAPPEYREIITRWYEKMDEILGRVMARVGEKDTLIVLSDHGFDTYRRSAHVNSWLREQGFLELKDAAALEGEPLLKSIDWSGTRAYAIGFGSIYINQKGREAEGVVSPGEEKERLKDEIASRLEQWTDKKFQERIVSKVYKQQDVFWGQYAPDAPDLIVGFNAGYGASWQTALGAVPKDLIEDNVRKWSGSHLFDPRLVDGVLFTNRPLLKDNPAITDIAPTILRLTGFSDEELKTMDFDGEPLLR